MAWETTVEAISAGTGSALLIGESTRRYWRRRETRLRAEFTRDVQAIVDQSMADVIARQAEFERRQGKHLDKQDRDIAAIAALIRKFHGGGQPGAG